VPDPVPTEQVFRTEWPRLVAALVRDLRDLQLAEDCAAAAFEAAAEQWVDGQGRWQLPERPGAWLLTTARRRGIDQLRRADRYQDKLAQVAASARSATGAAQPHSLVDDQLALLFGCCHPALDRQAQVALTLRSVAGLRTGEIARAFLVPEATMAKRLTRAKNKIAAANIPFTTPDRDQLGQRLPAVLSVVYLIFNQGHSGTEPTARPGRADPEPNPQPGRADPEVMELVRGDLCDEALWLVQLLTELLPQESEVNGLAALLLLTDARRASRLGGDGLPVLLEDQDRSRWDRDKIELGSEFLRTAHACGEPGVYGLQAAVALVHALAPTFAATDWEAIVEIYDRLLELHESPLFRLNRAVALSYVDGPLVGLRELDLLADVVPAGYHYLDTARGEFLVRVGRFDDAVDAFRRAYRDCQNPTERAWLERRIDEISRSD
jgi:RNA polymerase sigma-70 factor (ECF subfamily)